MADIRIDADALYRAVTAFDYKLLAYYLDLRSGEITSRTLTPEEVHDVPPSPRIAPLPPGGGDVTIRSEPVPFGPSGGVARKADLFKNDPTPKKDTFGGDFWKREKKESTNPFGGGDPRRESSAKKLASLFGEKPPEQTKPAPKPAVPADAPSDFTSHFDPSQPLQRIPVADVEQHRLWLRAFAQDCGDPEIRDQLLPACESAQPLQAFLKVLRKFQRMGQQWDKFHRRQSRHFAEQWLKALPLTWELVDPPHP